MIIRHIMGLLKGHIYIQAALQAPRLPIPSPPPLLPLLQPSREEQRWDHHLVFHIVKKTNLEIAACEASVSYTHPRLIFCIFSVIISTTYYKCLATLFFLYLSKGKPPQTIVKFNSIFLFKDEITFAHRDIFRIYTMLLDLQLPHPHITHKPTHLHILWSELRAIYLSQHKEPSLTKQDSPRPETREKWRDCMVSRRHKTHTQKKRRYDRKENFR